MKKLLSLVLAVVMVFGLVACGNGGSETTAPAGSDPAVAGDAASYTYKTYSTALATNWNPHAWEMSNDSTILEWVTTPLVYMSIDNSEDGIYQWVYDGATYVTDVTKDHQDDLTKYEVTLPAGQTVEQTEAGYVFEIGLNPEMKWEDGTPINADSYIYSMKALLDPAMKNYRANLYYTGESAVAGGDDYFYAGSTAYVEDATPLDAQVVAEDGSYTAANGDKLYFALTTALSWLSGETLDTYVTSYGADYFDVAAYESLKALADENGNVAVNAESLPLMTAVISVPAWGEGPGNEQNYVVAAHYYPECEYDGVVGCYKVDDYTIRYVTQAYIEINPFRIACGSTWLVHEGMYEAGKTQTGDLTATNFNTTAETTMSSGPYRIESLQEGKQMVLVKNENWYGYEKQADGSLVAMTPWLIDGESVERYQTNRIVIDVMDDDAAKQAFLKGELSEWTPSADDVLAYATSERLYKVEETYTQSFFFNTNIDALKTMDASKGNTNSVVLSNDNFRKAFSLGIDRAELVGATSGYKPAYSLMNSLYFYDIYNDPESSYRNSDEAMQAICNLYGVEYGEGKAYGTLKEAYQSINGYNLTEAKTLMATACTELVDAGLYTAGDPIVIRIGWAKGALTSADNQQLALVNKYINAAAEGSGFGTITLEAVGNIENRYDAVPQGEYAIGYGAWGGAWMYPFRNFQVYCDTDLYSVNETGCWDPATEKLTLNVEGEEVEMTWKDWSNALTGTGPYAAASNELKLDVTAQMEELYLKKYYRIPLMSTTACFMVSYQLDYFTENYNVMYGFGGLELMTYNYTDAEWADFIAESNGAISYE